MIRLSMALREDFDRMSAGGYTGIDGRFALFGDSGLLAEEDHGEGCSTHTTLKVRRAEGRAGLVRAMLRRE